MLFRAKEHGACHPYHVSCHALVSLGLAGLIGGAKKQAIVLPVQLTSVLDHVESYHDAAVVGPPHPHPLRIPHKKTGSNPLQTVGT